jgi:hypothetical protein
MTVNSNGRDQAATLRNREALSMIADGESSGGLLA